VLVFVHDGETSVQLELRANKLAQALNNPIFAASNLPHELNSNGFAGTQAVDISRSASVNEAEGAITNDSAENPPVSTPTAVILVVVVAVLSGVGTAIGMYYQHAKVGQSKIPASREEKTPLVV
jgi:hypothetical protein